MESCKLKMKAAVRKGCRFCFVCASMTKKNLNSGIPDLAVSIQFIRSLVDFGSFNDYLNSMKCDRRTFLEVLINLQLFELNAP